MKVQSDEDSGKTLLGGDTGSGAVMLHADSTLWISTGIPCIYTYTFEHTHTRFQLVQTSTCAEPYRT